MITIGLGDKYGNEINYDGYMRKQLTKDMVILLTPIEFDRVENASNIDVQYIILFRDTIRVGIIAINSKIISLHDVIKINMGNIVFEHELLNKLFPSNKVEYIKHEVSNIEFNTLKFINSKFYIGEIQHGNHLKSPSILLEKYKDDILIKNLEYIGLTEFALMKEIYESENGVVIMSNLAFSAYINKLIRDLKEK